MKSLTFKVSKDVLKEDFPFLVRDFKSEEVLELDFRINNSQIGKNGIWLKEKVSVNKVELPTHILYLNLEGKSFGIFMTEHNRGTETIYLKELPFSPLDLLTKIQSKELLKNPLYKKENRVLKIYLGESEARIGWEQLEDWEALF